MKSELLPAIEALQKELREDERKVVETRAMINRLCLLAGVEPKYPEGSKLDRAAASSPRADQFYRKPLHTAARECLEMRHAANLGPAAPREIYVALVEGGFAFETRNEIYAIQGLRAVLRKNSSIFHRLPNGQYGLLSWYPNARTKPDVGQEERFLSPRKSKFRTSGSKHHTTTRPSVTPFVLEAMQDRSGWTTDKLKEKALQDSIPGIDVTTQRNVFHGALLSLMKKGRVTQIGGGAWKIVDRQDDASAQIVPIKGAA